MKRDPTYHGEQGQYVTADTDREIADFLDNHADDLEANDRYWHPTVMVRVRQAAARLRTLSVPDDEIAEIRERHEAMALAYGEYPAPMAHDDRGKLLSALTAIQSREAGRDAYIKYRLATAEEEFDIIRKQLEAENANLIAREADVRREERERCAKVADAHGRRPPAKITQGFTDSHALTQCIRDEERGEKTASEVIAKAIRALSPSQEGNR